MIKSAAEILAEIEDTEPVKKLAKVRDARFIPAKPMVAKPRPKPRPDRRERSIDREADARAYRLAAIEHGVYLLLPRDLYGRGES